MRAAAITVAVALAALAMGTASARAADRAEVGAMIDVATTYFGKDCVAGIKVAWVVPGGLDGPDVPGGHGIGRGAGCRVWLDTGYFDSASWGGACALVVHEAGHAVGSGHSLSPASVMYSPAPARVPLRASGRLRRWRWRAAHAVRASLSCPVRAGEQAPGAENKGERSSAQTLAGGSTGG